MPDSFETRNMAQSARMKRAAQVVTRSTFRSFRALHALRQRRHDSAPLAVAHRRPTGDFVDGAATADAQPCLGVEQANVDARGLQGSAGRLSRRLCRDWGNRKPEAGHSRPAAGGFSSPEESACSTDFNSSLPPDQRIWIPRQYRINADSRTAMSVPPGPSNRCTRAAYAKHKKMVMPIATVAARLAKTKTISSVELV